MGSRLYIDNLPLTTTLLSLTELFAKSGKVDSINIVMDQRTGKLEGHAFVEMATEADAKSAIAQLNGTDLEGKRLTVTQAGPAARHAGFSGSATTEERKNR